MTRATAQVLDQGWSWKEHRPTSSDILSTISSQEDWTPASTFPSEIHVELLDTGKIQDPFLGFNEHDVQWVGETEWLYRSSFSVAVSSNVPNPSGGILYELCFEGLDTFCDVYLDQKLILQADNMFRTYMIPLNQEQLGTEEIHTLTLHFKSAKQLAKTLEAQFGVVRAGSTNLGDPSRVYVRKAQYDWRWDWGPELMTCGPYRSITLQAYTCRIASLWTHAIVSEAPSLVPSFRLDVAFKGTISSAKSLKFALKKVGEHDLIKTAQVALHPSQEHTTKEASLDKIFYYEDLSGEVDLWWPVGYGSQALYDVEVTLIGENDAVLDCTTQRIGFRRIELIQEPLPEADQYGKGTTFLFEVNGIRMFMGGSNWIPADNFLTRISNEKYRAWLMLLRDGNQNMVRLWGGGVYEPDVFYDICDELGIFVWQDFQFACGVYPAHDSFVESVRAEAIDNITRMRRHPSLAIFCGNNEDYQQVLQWGDVADLPARKLYEDLLPTLVNSLTSPPIPYHRGSPYGGEGWDTADPTVGDVHQWDIWGGKEKPWQEYWRMGGRFVSEFGIPAFPDIRTIDYWLDGDTTQRYAQSQLMAQHCRAGGFERRFAIVMGENVRWSSDLETHIYNTQLVQSEALGLAYRSWRREWRGKGKEFCAGALVWQLNDCWPVTSWAIADYFLRPKPAYYAIARELRPIAVGAFRKVHKNRPNDRPVQFYEFGAFLSTNATLEVWGANSTLKPIEATLVVSFMHLTSNWIHQEPDRAVTLLPNQSTELLQLEVPEPPLIENTPTTNAPRSNGRETTNKTRTHEVVASIKLIDPNTGDVLARYVDWPQPYRHIDFPKPNLQLNVVDDEVEIEVKNPVKCLVLSVDEALSQNGTEVKWSDNGLDVVPGEKIVIKAQRLGGRRVKAAYVGKETATIL